MTVTGGGSIGECGRLSQPSCDFLANWNYLLTYFLAASTYVCYVWSTVETVKSWLLVCLDILIHNALHGVCRMHSFSAFSAELLLINRVQIESSLWTLLYRMLRIVRHHFTHTYTRSRWIQVHFCIMCLPAVILIGTYSIRLLWKSKIRLATENRYGDCFASRRYCNASPMFWCIYIIPKRAVSFQYLSGERIRFSSELVAAVMLPALKDPLWPVPRVADCRPKRTLVNANVQLCAFTASDKRRSDLISWLKMLAASW